MATKKILYFTAGPVPTAGELADIDVLNTLILPGYSIGVRNGAESGSFGAGIEATDFVAGTVPTAFNARPAYGFIDALRPLVFDVWPKTAAIVGTATKQLYPVKISGTDIANLASALVTANIGYVSSDETKATVHATSGLITGVAAGTSTITATLTYATGKTITATCVVTVS
jgi:hypothetical protein